MGDYVTLALVAPMGSFGGLAGHERRGSGNWPGRSAILGLIGAALGIRRDDAEGQAALKTWRCAVSVLSEGNPLQDFHTVQTVPSAKIKRPATRADALRALKPGDNAVITRRDYRCDCAFGVALWGGTDPPALVAALKRPHFVPCLGRKSCPLSAPMAPQVVAASNAAGALAQVQLPPFLPRLAVLRIVSDEPAAHAISETVWDEPLSRNSWHFAPRKVFVSVPEEGS